MYDESEEMQIKAAIEASLQDLKNQSQDSDSDSDSKFTTPFETNDWRTYLGSDESPKVEIVIRYPDGNREKVIFPSTSKLKVKLENKIFKNKINSVFFCYQALFLYVKDHGYDTSNYDLITNFPKKILSTCNETITLEEAGIHSRDTLYVQTKN